MSMRPGVETFQASSFTTVGLFIELYQKGRFSWSIVVLFPSIYPHFHFAVDRY